MLSRVGNVSPRVRAVALAWLCLTSLLGLLVGCSQTFSSSAPLASTTGLLKEPPSAPILRIESETHTARISRIGVDANNRFLVTASDDKSVRVWELPTGRLLRVLRPPIGEGNEGKLYAVALSPDGNTVACAGWTGLAWDGWHSIYLFDRASGRMTGRITELPYSIPHLAYAPDGRALVVTLHGKYGIRVYRTTDNMLLAEDRAYGAESYGAAFDRSGRLVTSSYDGYLRLYDRDFRLLAKEKPPGGERPYGVSITPDGTRVAVGFEDSPAVSVSSGKDLKHLFFADTTVATKGSFSTVAWSSDGQELYAAGQYHVNGKHPVRLWTNEGRSPGTDLPAAENTIMHLFPLSDGGMAYGASDPAFGFFDAHHHRILYRKSALLDYRDHQADFLFSGDGMTVQFSSNGTGTFRFNLHERTFEKNPIADHQLISARTSGEGISLADWKNSNHPTINGRLIKLDPHDLSRSAAIAPDDQSALLGTAWSLRLLDRSGRELWRIPTPGNVWGVNIARNGRVAIATLGDGTVRWYRLADGQELVSLFPHPDQQRWVVWTPSGYYDAGPGAESLLGWHKNYGPQRAADFFPTGRFRALSYRPKVVATILTVLDEQEAVRIALGPEHTGLLSPSSQNEPHEGLLPVVTILSPEDGTTLSSAVVTVRYSIRTATEEPITDVQGFVDGRSVPIKRGVAILGRLPTEANIQELQIQIPGRDCEISIVARTRSASSIPASVRLRWKGPAPEAFAVKPILYALVIGISQYKDRPRSLEFAAKEAQDFAATLRQQEGALYRGVSVKILTDAQATRDNILDALDWLDKETTSKDLAIIFLKGLGVTDKHGIHYFLASDSHSNEPRRTALATSDLKNVVGSLAGKVVVFADTCYALDPVEGRSCPAWASSVVSDLPSTDNGAVVISSARRQPSAGDLPASANGAFTKAIIEGLQGQAAYGAARSITVNMLDIYVTQRLKELTGGQQIAITTKPFDVADFVVGTVREDHVPRPASGIEVPKSKRPSTQESTIEQRLPPVVTILSPQDGTAVSSSLLTVRYTLRAPSGEPVTDVTGLIDGRPVPASRKVDLTNSASEQQVQELNVPIPQRDSEISILAKNRWASSEPSTIRVHWKGSAPDHARPKPTLYALIVGISQYEQPEFRLKLAAKDARDFAAAVRRQEGGLYREVVTKILTDAEATKEHILAGLDWIDAKTTSSDVAAIFLAGHGVNDKSGIYYFLPATARLDQLRRTALPFSDIRNTVGTLAGKTLLFADTCHSGNIMGGRRGVVDINAVVNELTSAENGVVVFASSTGRQDALEDSSWGNGAFTKALVEGLGGKAAYSSSKAITVNMLDLYVSERVKTLTKGQQTPTTTKPHTIPDFPVALASGDNS